MFIVRVRSKSGDFDETVSCRSRVCDIGKSKDALIRAKSWSVAPRHLRLEQDLAGVFVEDTSRGFGIKVNGQTQQRFGPLRPDDIVAFGPFTLTVINQDNSEFEAANEDSDDWSPEADTTDDVSDARDGPVETSENDAALYMEWAKLCHRELLRQLDVGRVHIDKMSHDEVRELMEGLIDKALATLDKGIPEYIDRIRLKKIVLDESVGLGAIEELLADKDVTEVMVNNFDDIYIEKAGKLQHTSVQFSSADAVLATIERIISPLGRRIDESSPMVDARLRDGSRVNAIIPPLALRGPCITIRKFSEKKLTDKDLLGFGAVNEQMVEFLSIAVINRMNIVVSGGTGSGKTTLLNILSNYIPMDERVVTVEDAAELRLVQPHVVSLEARPPNLEGRGAVSIRDLVKNCLRMRPDRIVVGECRGGEALDMLQAMNTGHEGSLSTLHANTPRDALRRLETMVLLAGVDLPLRAIREQIASAIDVVVQLNRDADGRRLVTSITEVVGMEGDVLSAAEIFQRSPERGAALVATGVVGMRGAGGGHG